MSDRKSSQISAGLILIAIGLGLYLIERVEGIGSEAVMMIIGVAFLIAYFVRKNYGLLIPGWLLLGLGLGQVGEGSFLAFGEASTLESAEMFRSICMQNGLSLLWPSMTSTLPYRPRSTSFGDQ